MTQGDLELLDLKYSPVLKLIDNKLGITYDPGTTRLINFLWDNKNKFITYNDLCLHIYEMPYDLYLMRTLDVYLVKVRRLFAERDWRIMRSRGEGLTLYKDGDS